METVDLRRIYKLGDQEVHALRGLNLQIGRGQFVALKGRSGSGKTTLLNCLSGLDQPTKGSIRIFGEEIGQWNERKLTAWRREQVGFIFQSLGLLPALSAYENVELILRMNKVKSKERHKITTDCLDLVGIGKWADHRPYEMSGGQQQRVAIARALANQPKLIIADEPTGELDSKTGHEILGLFKKIIRERNMTMLMATHDSLSDEYVDQVLHLQDGQIHRIEIPEAARQEQAEQEAASAAAVEAAVEVLAQTETAIAATP
ncbi:MAG: ABC transporter ATP-binding protein [Caldilineaceae bacterium]|nr:ABC transporter ATP-binding protein [Caldilineaceae bacterium]